jgi:hypothetical protein
MPTITQVITSGTTWTVPAGVTSATVECIGSGSAGGGAYSRTNSVSLTPGATVFIRIDAGAGSQLGPTWFNKTANTAPTTGQTDRGASAAGGSGAWQTQNVITALGGAASNSVGDVRYSGGRGRYLIVEYCDCRPTLKEIYSRGGAAGPNGNGADGLISGQTYGGGGGANGGSAGTSTSGGNNRLGTGGGSNSGGSGSNGGGGGPNGAGTTGAASYDPIYTDTYSGLTYGPSGGVGSSSNGGNAPAVTRGAGGGSGNGGIGTGTPGMIILTYDAPATGSTSNMLMFFQ